ncbi:hypothetical protein D9619_006311 [Psilocybe cf. subviscida]|uniref:ZZ-type domain-containing protein n=1 Tax=Psilocybe cf. subviscida TaxID=2480587 RepID=A0A8H5B5V9_9AGAR|nr:hypothetical protein D9619_006311 [Psilocybe cf. subviscida]
MPTPSKVEQCFSLYATSFAVSYKDDDGEITDISTNHDLIEAIQYFSAGDDVPISSAASILSGRSFGARKITLRVNINVEYDGPSLSDTSSLASLDDFKSKNGSEASFSFGSPSVDLDDDSVTVSSRDPGTSASRSVRSGAGSGSLASGHIPAGSSSLKGSRTAASQRYNDSQTQIDPSVASFDIISHSDALNSTESQRIESAAERFPEDPSAVFERLRLSESNRKDDSSSLDYESVVASDRGAAWIRDQNERAIRSMVGAYPEPSDTDGMSLSLNSQDDGQLGGDLALERDQRGKYYYTYTSSSSSHFQESVGDEVRGGNSVAGDDAPPLRGPRPSSMQLRWVAAQQKETASNRRPNLQALSIQEETTDVIPHEIDKELLPFLPVVGPLPEILTDCSNCGILLEAIRYICSTCGEKAPAQSLLSEQANQGDSPTTVYTYPPPQHRVFSSPNSSSSQTYIGSPDSIHSQRYKPLPSIPSATSLPYVQSMFNGSRGHLSPTPSSSSSGSVPSAGYELCSACVESVGIRHAIEAGLNGPGTPPVGNGLYSAHDDPQRAQQWRRTAPKKGQLRHAYQEKVWGHHGWEDVVLDEALVSKCSTCSAITDKKRYKCTSCSNLHICRACYSQVHELHPTHAFLIIPDKPAENGTIPDFSPDDLPDPNEEISLKHPGVACAQYVIILFDLLHSVTSLNDIIAVSWTLLEHVSTAQSATQLTYVPIVNLLVCREIWIQQMVDTLLRISSSRSHTLLKQQSCKVPVDVPFTYGKEEMQQVLV